MSNKPSIPQPLNSYQPNVSETKLLNELFAGPPAATNFQQNDQFYGGRMPVKFQPQPEFIGGRTALDLPMQFDSNLIQSGSFMPVENLTLQQQIQEQNK
jgi:hypothetical protein